jgi:predicted transcriptional regulator
MVKWPVQPACIMLSFLLCMAPVAVADNGGYVVHAASADDLSGTPQDPVPVSFWELSPRVMMIAITLSFFPLLLFPVELLFMLKIFAWLGYRKISRNAVLENQNRLIIFEAIREHPGINYHDLYRMTGIKPGVLRYHLAILGIHAKIIHITRLHATGYFENSGKFTEFEKRMIKHLQNTTARRVIEIIMTSPNISRRDIAEMIGIAGPSVTWHTNRLFRGGIIMVRKNGRDASYALSREAAVFFRTFYQNYPG